MNAIHLLVGGPVRTIMVDGVEYRFEDHHVCGPIPIKRDGRERTLGPRHRFWLAVTQWYAGGKMIGADGRCTWSEPPDPTAGMVKIGRNYYSKSIVARLSEKR